MAWFTPMAVRGTVARPARTSTSTVVAVGAAAGAACAAGVAETAATRMSRAVLARTRRPGEVSTADSTGAGVWERSHVHAKPRRMSMTDHGTALARTVGYRSDQA